MHKDESLTNLLAAHHALLHERLQYFINDLPLPLRDDVYLVFKEPGKLFVVQNDIEFALPLGIWAMIW